MPERIDGILLLKFFIQLLRSAAINIRIVLAMIMAIIIHIIGISKNGKLIPTAPSSILDRHPMADMENAAAILPVLTINFLKFLLGISRLREKARPKSSRDNPNDNKARAR
nr:hypothetical protein [Candidatus Methanodesulfokores washburnensis]